MCDNRDENRKGKGKTKRTRVRSVWVPNLRHEEKTLQLTGIEKKRKIPHIQQNTTNNTLINKYVYSVQYGIHTYVPRDKH